MKEETRKSRRAQIEAATYEVLQETGYRGTSMLAVAKAAKASNETLYRWYGDKQGLFAALVAGNAQAIKDKLEASLDPLADPEDGLRQLAPLLLQMLTSDRAVALNRAAAADESDALGLAIAKGGRDAVAPLIGDLISRAMAAGKIDAPNPHQAAEWYISLVIGDAQIRRVIGVTQAPDAETVNIRAQAGVAAFFKLVAPKA
jgi:AcrR family transcriptional regulator